jgi:cobalt/nickel transport system permease protein
MNRAKEALLHSHHGHHHTHPAAFFARLDARAVVITWLAYTVILISVPKYDVTGVAALAALPLFALVASGVRPGPVFRKLLYLSPFILLSAAANPFLDRRPMAEIAGLTLSAGMVSGLVIVLKAAVSIMAVLTLAACLPFDHLCHALRKMRVPEVFTTQLMLLHRYSFVLADEARAMKLARDIRSFNGRGKALKTTVNLIGSLFLRSNARAGRVHSAMLSRGFHGTVSCCQEVRAFAATDALFLAGTIGLAGLLRIIF